MAIRHDLHIHTTCSPCCSDQMQTPDRILIECQRLGLRKIGLADHVWLRADHTPGEWRGGAYSDLKKFRQRHTEETAGENHVTILYGCEADTLSPGVFSITKKFAQTVDYVIMAANHFHFRDTVMQPSQITPQAIGDHMLKMFQATVRSGMADIIPHVFMPMGYWQYYESAVAAISDAQFIEVFSEAAAGNIAIELSPVYLPPPIGSLRQTWHLDTPLRVLALAKQAGCRFTFGSDAHNLSGLKRINAISLLIEKLKMEPVDLHPLGQTD